MTETRVLTIWQPPEVLAAVEKELQGVENG
jgi:hypothetical protein